MEQSEATCQGQITQLAPADPETPTPMVVARLVRHAMALGLDTQPLEDLLASNPPVVDDGVTHTFEIKARALIQTGAPFAEAALWFWRIFARAPTEDLAVRMVEYACFKGTYDEQIAVVKAFIGQRLHFFHRVEPHLRCGLLTAIYAETPQLAETLLGQLPHDGAWEPLEHLISLLLRHEGGQDDDLYRYYWRHQPKIDGAAKVASFPLKEHLPGLYYALALVALGHFDIKKALHALAGVEPAGIWLERVAALKQKLCDGEAISDEAGLLIRVKESSAWPLRITALKEFFELVEKRRESYGPSRLVLLNDMLGAPLKLLPENPVTLNELAQLLASHLRLHDALPHLKQVFLDRAGIFAGRHHEIALWSPLKDAREPTALFAYLRGVALLHLTLAAEGGDDDALCLSHDLIEKNGPLISPLAAAWRAIVGAFLSAAPGRKSQGGEDLLAAKLMAIAGWHLCDASQQKDLLAKEQASPKFLARLIRVLPRDEAGDGCRLQLWEANPLSLRRTNSDLDAIWLKACAEQDFDLAWRTASVALARNVLNPAIFQVWSLFGKKMPMTVEWPSFSLPLALLSLDHKSPQIRQMIDDLVALRPILLPILAKTDPRPWGESLLWRFPAVKGAVDAVGWLSRGEKGIPAESVLPPADGRVFSMTVAEIAGRLGISSFQWEAARLRQTILPYAREYASGIARVADPSLLSASHVNPSRHTRLSSLAQMLGVVPAHELREILLTFVTRVAVTLGGDHFGALADLQKMAVDLRMVNQLENWILGDTYSRIRKKMRILNRHLVPAGLRTEKLISQRA